MAWSTEAARRARPYFAPGAAASGWPLRQTVLIAVLVLSLGGLAAADAARGQAVLDPVVEAHLGAAAEYYAAETGAAELPCGLGCQALKNDLRRAPTKPVDPVPGRVAKSFMDKVKSQVKSPWKLPASTILSAGSLITANVYVWKVHVLGARPKDYFIKVNRDAFHSSDVTNWVTSDGSNPNIFTTYRELPSPVPFGVVARADRGTVLWQTSSMQASRCSDPGPTSTPTGVEEYVYLWNRCYEGWFEGVGDVYSDLFGHGWAISLETLFERWYDAQSRPDLPTDFVIQGVELTQAEIEQRLRELIASGDADYKIVEAWINAVFGGEKQNPKDVYRTVPSCGGLTPTGCTGRLAKAGFSGARKIVTLSSGDADPTRLPGEVTGTVPEEGLAVAVNKGFTVYVNPPTVPPLTQTEESVAAALQAQNPQTVTDSNKRMIARECVQLVTAAGRPAQDCSSLPILVQGTDVPGPAQNEIDALVRDPQWVALNRRESITRTGWYTNRSEPAPGCALATKPQQASQCDEFPFWSTLQAYGGTLNFGTLPGIRWVRDVENRRQGAVLAQFYSANQNGEFKGCSIAPQMSTEVVPRSESTFLNVPVPPGTLPVKSTGICNKP